MPSGGRGGQPAMRPGFFSNGPMVTPPRRSSPKKSRHTKPAGSPEFGAGPSAPAPELLPPGSSSTEPDVKPPVNPARPFAEPPEGVGKTPTEEPSQPVGKTPTVQPLPHTSSLAGQWRVSTGERLHIEDDGDGIVLTLQKDKTLGSNRATFSHLNGALSRRGSQPDYFDGTVQATFPGDRGTYKGKTIGHLKNPTTLELKVTLEVPMRIKGKTTSATRYRSCTLTKED